MEFSCKCFVRKWIIFTRINKTINTFNTVFCCTIFNLILITLDYLLNKIINRHFNWKTLIPKKIHNIHNFHNFPFFCVSNFTEQLKIHNNKQTDENTYNKIKLWWIPRTKKRILICAAIKLKAFLIEILQQKKMNANSLKIPMFTMIMVFISYFAMQWICEEQIFIFNSTQQTTISLQLKHFSFFLNTYYNISLGVVRVNILATVLR